MSKKKTDFVAEKSWINVQTCTNTRECFIIQSGCQQRRKTNKLYFWCVIKSRRNEEEKSKNSTTKKCKTIINKVQEVSSSSKNEGQLGHPLQSTHLTLSDYHFFLHNLKKLERYSYSRMRMWKWWQTRKLSSTFLLIRYCAFKILQEH